MKLNKIFVMMIVVLSLFAVSVTAAPSLAKFDVVLLNYEPSPAEPGSYIDVDIRATNVGSSNSLRTKFELVPEFPFSLDSNEEALSEYGEVSSSQEIILDYKIRVASNAVFGKQPLKLRYTTDGQTWVTEELEIDVRTSEAFLSVDEITMPESLIPGETSEIKIVLKNLAQSTIKDVSVKLDLETEFSAAGTISQDLPFITVGSGIEKKIKFVSSNKEYPISFNLRTYADAESKIYKVPLIITYSDESGMTYTVNEILGIVVGSEPDLSLEVDSCSFIAPMVAGKVDLKIVNKDVTDVKFLSAKLIESEGYTVDKMSAVYIGGIDSDDYESVEFSLTPSTTENFDAKVELNYQDANNKEYSETLSVGVPASCFSNGGSKKSPLGNVFLVIVVVGIALFFWKRHKKKRKH